MGASGFRFLIRAGLFLVTLSSVLLIIHYLPLDKPKDKLKIDINGNKRISKKELKELILYISRTEKEGLSLKDIKTTLLLNPFIDSVEIIKSSENHIIVNIKEVSGVYYEQHGSEILEKKINGEVLEENILVNRSRYAKKVENFDQKIVFYLTKGDLNNNVPQRYKRDIILLWEKTNLQYYGLWQNISEIRFIRKNDRMIARVFPVKTNAAINVYSVWNEALIKKLEAVLFLLMAQHEKKYREVDLYDKNAIIREIGST